MPFDTTHNISSALDFQNGKAQSTEGTTISTLLASLATAIIFFAVEFLLFLFLKGKLPRIYQPRTYLVPERERVDPLPAGLFRWIGPVFRTSSSEFIHKCGLDAFFFLRYLRMLIKIFVPLSFVIIPVLIPLNKVDGKDQRIVPGPSNTFAHYNVTGLDQLAWGNISPKNTSRYWGHFILAVIVVVYVCAVFFDELRGYIRLRQAFLTSPQHRLRASATTVLVASIPQKWLSVEALDELFHVFPGGIRNIWINRNFDELNMKVKARNGIALALERAETELIQKCKMAQLKQVKRSRSKEKKTHGQVPSNEKTSNFANEVGISSDSFGRVSLSTKYPTPVSSYIEPIASLDKKKSKDQEYRIAYNENFRDNDYGEPVWKKYIRPKDRSTIRLPIFGWSWMPSLPLIGKKVDEIDCLRAELARLNLEIEVDQQNPEKFPLMNSAFIQFNHQVAAHMACQCVSHHLPSQMTPRLVEVSPDDVIWDNMSIKWWERYLRTFGVMGIVIAMVIGWAFPVAFTGMVSQLTYLEMKFAWLRWINDMPRWLLSAIQGVLPPMFLSILMTLLPFMLRFLARNQGVLTGTHTELNVQNYYFAFLFVQLFLIVSVVSSISTILSSIRDVLGIPSLLAQNIPRASNYFFSFLVIQALSVSAGALVQIYNLVSWFILAPLLDKTARMKWARTTNLNVVQWGTFFPIFTTLAAIGIIYSVISPLIMVFAVLTFCLFWIVYRYNTLYVTKFRLDTGGLLFPTAINQLFTGVYVMEMCLIGLFFLVRDQHDHVACKGQAIGMIVVLAITIGYQYLLNDAFDPLFRYLPITLEGEATRRDEEFALVQRRKFRLDDNGMMTFKPQQVKQSCTDWARSRPLANGEKQPTTERKLDHFQRKDEESQEPTHPAARTLFSHIKNDLEDLTPAERNRLVQRAFQHEALRTKRPVVWLPRDDLGISDDEVFRTQLYSKHIWVSNEYQMLDARGRIVFSRNPPDFSEVDLVQL